jgi:hypothetical protein
LFFGFVLPLILNAGIGITEATSMIQRHGQSLYTDRAWLSTVLGIDPKEFEREVKAQTKVRETQRKEEEKEEKRKAKEEEKRRKAQGAF